MSTVSPVIPAVTSRAGSSMQVYARAAALLAIALLGVLSTLRWRDQLKPTAYVLAENQALGTFPEQIGSYHLERRWNEQVFGGTLLYHWAQYVPADGTAPVSIGISPILGSHDSIVCHSARGEDPLWEQAMLLDTAGTGSGKQIGFSAYLFNDGAEQYVEADTLCNGPSCGEFTSGRTHLGFIFSKPDPLSLVSDENGRPMPVIVKAESIDTTMPVDLARQQLTGSIRNFMAGVDLAGMTQPYRHR